VWLLFRELKVLWVCEGFLSLVSPKVGRKNQTQRKDLGGMSMRKAWGGGVYCNVLEIKSKTCGSKGRETRKNHPRRTAVKKKKPEGGTNAVNEPGGLIGLGGQSQVTWVRSKKEKERGFQRKEKKRWKQEAKRKKNWKDSPQGKSSA